MQIESFAASDIGLRRESNEDRYLVDDGLQLLAVSDGMGGHAAGEVAASRSLEIAAQYLREHSPLVRSARSTPDGYFRALRLAEDAVEEASRQLYQEALADPRLAGMGSTLTLLMVVDDKGIMAHVGDSRLYLLREGKLHLLSSDHTMAHEMYQTGALTRDEAQDSPYSHVLTRSIGAQEAVQVESLLFDLLPGDVCLACSDGLSNYFQDDRELSHLLVSEELDRIPGQLVELAKSRGGSDNITAVVARVTDGPEGSSRSAAELNECLEAIRSVFLFRGLTFSRLARVVNIASIRDCSAGHALLAVGDPCHGLYIVVSGRVATESPASPRRVLTAGDCFGADSLLDKQLSRGSAVAVDATRVLFMPGDEFDRLTQRWPKLGRRLLRRLGQQLSKELHRLLTIEDLDPGDTVDWSP